MAGHFWTLFISCGGVLSFNLDEAKRGTKAKVLRSVLVPESWWSHRELRAWAAPISGCHVLFAPQQRAQTGCSVGRSVLEGSLQHHESRMSLSLSKWVRWTGRRRQRTFIMCLGHKLIPSSAELCREMWPWLCLLGLINFSISEPKPCFLWEQQVGEVWRRNFFLGYFFPYHLWGIFPWDAMKLSYINHWVCMRDFSLFKSYSCLYQ